jgi:uncharacterized protein YbjT (DUF2867 family)
MVDKLKVIPVVNGARYHLQPVHPKDLGNAYYDILVNPSVTAGKDYTLSGKDKIMLIDILKEIAHCLGVKRRFVNVPFFVAYAGSWIIYVLTLKKIDMREKVQRLCEDRVYPYEEANRDFGYSPIPFKEGLKAEVEEYSAMTER